jgi:hypothetical protein
MIKLKIHKANELEKNAKCTVHTSGKLGFSEGGAKKFGLTQDLFVVVATNEEDEGDPNLYAWVEKTDENGGFKVCKAGEYFYLNTKALFEKLQLDFRSKEVVNIYDIVAMDYEGQSIFKLLKRSQKRTIRQKNKTVASDD